MRSAAGAKVAVAFSRIIAHQLRHTVSIFRVHWHKGAQLNEHRR